MAELRHNQTLSFPELRQLTARHARYESRPDPAVILRAGLIEEAGELMMEGALDIRGNRSRIRGELGDLAWYASEISRYYGVLPDVLDGAREPLGSFQRYPTARRPLTQIFDAEARNLNAVDSAADLLPIYALRTVDVMNPRTDDLWKPDGQRVSLSAALGDLMIATAITARRAGVSLSTAAWQTHDKLEQRNRDVHVLEKAVHDRQMTSQREKLYTDPWVRQLLRRTIADNIDTLIADRDGPTLLP